jgi:hypothetical protein
MPISESLGAQGVADQGQDSAGRSADGGSSRAHASPSRVWPRASGGRPRAAPPAPLSPLPRRHRERRRRRPRRQRRPAHEWSRTLRRRAGLGQHFHTRIGVRRLVRPWREQVTTLQLDSTSGAQPRTSHAGVRQRCRRVDRASWPSTLHLSEMTVRCATQWRTSFATHMGSGTNRLRMTALPTMGSQTSTSSVEWRAGLHGGVPGCPIREPVRN